MSAALIRAANMRNSRVLYRHDLARGAVPQLVTDPHIFMIDFSSMPAAAIALAARQQAARFFATGERCALDQPCIPDINESLRPAFGRNLFETPEFLPEDLAFLAP